ncbi:MAG: MotA/TolQ/ExbB proton channel family protein [Opitutales bacterium]|nr:MotA/TolQ/ExbB proton channel family protein [Opitutales bacterium]
MKNKILAILRNLVPVFVLIAVLAPVMAFAQEAAADAAAAAEDGARDETFIDTLKQGGWVMWPLLFSSIALVWLVVDGFFRSAQRAMFPPMQVKAIRELFQAGDYRGVYEYCVKNRSSFSDVVRAGVVFLPDGKGMTEEAIFSEIMRVKNMFDTRISYLSVLGVCSPMIGLLGTVTGMKGAFSALSSSGAGDAGALAAHIGEVLVATATGLAVSIPAYLFYYFLRNIVATRIHDMQEVIVNLFRKMPYDKFQDVQIGDEEIYAAVPNWDPSAPALDENAEEAAPEESPAEA